MKNHYHTLGIPQNAPPEEIRKAYHHLALKYHPDKNPAPGAAVRFMEIQAAWEILSDEGKRAEYDSWFDAQNINEPAVDPATPVSYQDETPAHSDPYARQEDIFDEADSGSIYSYFGSGLRRGFDGPYWSKFLIIPFFLGLILLKTCIDRWARPASFSPANIIDSSSHEWIVQNGDTIYSGPVVDSLPVK